MPAKKPENTIDLNTVQILFSQDCDCTLANPDDCLIVQSVTDLLAVGNVCCEICGEIYTYDTEGLILR